VDPGIPVPHGGSLTPMASTRVKRARDAQIPGVEELRFDFAEDGDQDHEGLQPGSISGAHNVVPESVETEPVAPSDLISALSIVPPRAVSVESLPSISFSSSEPDGPAGSVSDAALSISDFYARVRGALREAFPEEIWVTGEICKVTASRGHHYLELADHLDDQREHLGEALPVTRPSAMGRNAAATLEVACWARDWPVVQFELAAVGVELVPGLVVRIRGKVSVWEGGSKLRFSMTALDVEALVGGIAAARRRLLATLAAEGLLEANRRLALPLVPLRIGLVTSPGSEAYRDFTGQLERSGYRFDVRFEPSTVQGPEAPAQIAGALMRLGAFEPQLVVVVRGGGAKGDLAAFDSELVARAIATAPFPVWTGVGHTGDRSVADDVAQQALVTPTQCGEAVVAVVAVFLEATDRRARRLAQRVEAQLDEASRELATSAATISRDMSQALERSAVGVRAAETRIANAALVAIERSQGKLVNRAQRLAAPATQQLVVQTQSVEHRRELLKLLDPRHQLERGWSLTRDETGKVVKSSKALHIGDRLITTFADGKVSSVVAELQLSGEEPEDATTSQGGIR
jgi:exodeoxyribonuclease VII large subunit